MSWPVVELQELCSPKQHKTIATKNLLDEGYPVFGANGQIGLYSSFTHEVPTIAITCRGATCGTVNVTPPNCYINGNAMALDNLDSSKADLGYLKYYLVKRGFQDVISGSAQPQITRAPLLTLKIPLPPLEEQKRIAAILDQADTIRRKRQAALDKLNTLGQSIFYDMFGGDEYDRDWTCDVVKAETVCHKITDGTHQAPKWAETGIPFIFVSNVRNQLITLETKKFVDEQEYAALTKSTPIELGDVLYTSVGSYGNAAVVSTNEKFVFQRHIAQLKPDKSKILPTFLTYALETPFARRQADRFCTGIAQKTVTLKVLRNIQIPVPEIDKQTEFCEAISLVKKHLEKHSNSLSSGETLFASLQQRAFRGEL